MRPNNQHEVSGEGGERGGGEVKGPGEDEGVEGGKEVKRGNRMKKDEGVKKDERVKDDEGVKKEVQPQELEARRALPGGMLNPHSEPISAPTHPTEANALRDPPGETAEYCRYIMPTPGFQQPSPSPAPTSATTVPLPGLLEGPGSMQSVSPAVQVTPEALYTVFIHSSGPWPPTHSTRWNRYDLLPDTPISSLFEWEGRTRPDTGLREMGGQEIEHYLGDVTATKTRLSESGWPRWVALRPCERLPQGHIDWVEFLRGSGP